MGKPLAMSPRPGLRESGLFWTTAWLAVVLAGTSAGTVLRAKMLEDDVFGQGATSFDFLDGDEAYKHAWATGHHHLFDLAVHPRGARGRLAAVTRGAFNVVKDEIKRRRSR